MKILLENSALILGIAISFYTISHALFSYLNLRRERYFVIARLSLKVQKIMELSEKIWISSIELVKKNNEYQKEINLIKKNNKYKEINDFYNLLLKQSKILNKIELNLDEEVIAKSLKPKQIDYLCCFLISLYRLKNDLNDQLISFNSDPTNQSVLQNFETLIETRVMHLTANRKDLKENLLCILNSFD
ncbi:hypothetical protein NRK67_00480 [Fusobacteria bacterium ZRK30]|nr:hypothetical protein NRK67_00480 [Fusobacteria bacterium ZRK30]